MPNERSREEMQEEGFGLNYAYCGKNRWNVHDQIPECA